MSCEQTALLATPLHTPASPPLVVFCDMLEAALGRFSSPGPRPPPRHGRLADMKAQTTGHNTGASLIYTDRQRAPSRGPHGSTQTTGQHARQQKAAARPRAETAGRLGLSTFRA